MTVALPLLAWLLGLCVGSFLNVVVFRLPAGMSLLSPSRSFCPTCRAPISAGDNIPVLSWLLLRGRCRACRVPISPQYPLVEALSGLAFLLAYVLIFDAAARLHVQQPRLATDWPLLASWLVLIAALIASSVVDLRWYLVDVRVTNFALLIGVLALAFWPRAAELASAFHAPLLGGASATLLVSGFLLWRGPLEPEPALEPLATPTKEQPAASRLARIGVAALLLTALGLLAGSGQSPELRDPLIWLGFGVIFVVTALAGGQSRDSDARVEAEIERESGAARAQTFAELRWLALPLMSGVLCYLLIERVQPVQDAWLAALRWLPIAGIAPLAGMAIACTGAVIAASAGWLLRIVFTLVFGREAFGVGDIYILAAAGACAGWDVALLGLLLSVGLAMVGWALGMFLKRSVLIPYGPWLSIGFVLALWLNAPAARVASIYAETVAVTWREQPAVLMWGGGVLALGFGFAVVIAKLLRRTLGG